jgi:hypothetical protein
LTSVLEMGSDFDCGLIRFGRRVFQRLGQVQSKMGLISLLNKKLPFKSSEPKDLKGSVERKTVP